MVSFIVLRRFNFLLCKCKLKAWTQCNFSSNVACSKIFWGHYPRSSLIGWENNRTDNTTMDPSPENNTAVRHPGLMKLEVLKSCVLPSFFGVSHNTICCAQHCRSRTPFYFCSCKKSWSVCPGLYSAIIQIKVLYWSIVLFQGTDYCALLVQVQPLKWKLPSSTLCYFAAHSGSDMWTWINSISLAI